MNHSTHDPQDAADDRDYALYRLLLEIRFAANLAWACHRQPLPMPTEHLAMTLSGFAERLDDAMHVTPGVTKTTPRQQ